MAKSRITPEDARIVFRSAPCVPRDVRREVSRVCRAFSRISAVQHRVSVYLVPAPAVGSPDGGFGFGACCVPAEQSGKVRIYIAGGLAREYQKEGGTRRDAVRAVGHTTLHELAHYEQFRDGKRLTEQGVERRAERLHRMADDLAEHIVRNLINIPDRPVTGPRLTILPPGR